MAETEAKSNSEKAAIAKEKAIEKSKEAENKVKDVAYNIEKSALGKNLPTKVENIRLYDIIMFIVFAEAILSLSVYFFSLLSSGQTGVKANILWVVSWLLLVLCPADGIVSACCVILRWSNGYVFLVLMKVAKLVLFILTYFLLGFSGTFSKILFIMYFLCAMLFMMMTLYYLAIYFKRVDSDEYDRYGELKEVPGTMQQGIPVMQQQMQPGVQPVMQQPVAQPVMQQPVSQPVGTNQTPQPPKVEDSSKK